MINSKIDAVTAPATVLIGGSFMSLNAFLEEGLPVIVQFGNAALILFGVLLAVSKWRLSRIETKLARIELNKAEKAGDE
jgi:hypothetical protein